MKLAIFEPDAAGHHMALHVRHIVGEALRRGWEVRLVTTKRAVTHPAYRILCDEFGDALRTSFMPDASTPEGSGDVKRTLDQLRRWSTFRAGYKSLAHSWKPDFVYMVNLDQIDMPMSMRGSPFRKTPFSGILMGRNFHCRDMGIKVPSGKLRERFMGPIFDRMIAIPTLTNVLTLDESMAGYAEKHRFPHWEKVRHIPDIASLATESGVEDPKSHLGIPKDKYVVLSYGALSERKGVSELLAGLAHTSCDPRVAVLFAGKQDAFAKRALLSPAAADLRQAGRLYELEGFLDDRQEALVFQAADAVWVGYRGWFGMSGVLIQAGTAGLPVIAMDQGLVAWLVQRHKSGLTVDISSAQLVADAATRLAMNPKLAASLGGNGKEIAKLHTPELFGKNICDTIEAGLGGAGS